MWCGLLVSSGRASSRRVAELSRPWQKQYPAADQINHRDGEDDSASPSPEAVIAHPLNHERRGNGPDQREHDARPPDHEFQVADSRKRTEIGRAQHMAEGLGDRL